MKFTALLLILAGCATAQAADEPSAASSLQTGSVSLSTLDTKLDGIATKVDANTTAVKGLAETIGNSNAGIDEVKGQLRTLLDRADAILDLVAEQATSKLVPGPVPLKSDAPPAENGDQRMVTIGDERVDVDAFVAKWHVPGFWKEVPNPPESHAEALVGHHGMLESEVAKLSEEDQSILHEAIHSRDLASQPVVPVVATPKPTVAADPRSSPPSVAGYRVVCENGVCRRVPILQAPAATSRREARRAAKGK